MLESGAGAAPVRLRAGEQELLRVGGRSEGAFPRRGFHRGGYDHHPWGQAHQAGESPHLLSCFMSHGHQQRSSNKLLLVHIMSCSSMGMLIYVMRWPSTSSHFKKYCAVVINKDGINIKTGCWLDWGGYYHRPAGHSHQARESFMPMSCFMSHVTCHVHVILIWYLDCDHFSLTFLPRMLPSLLKFDIVALFCEMS